MKNSIWILLYVALLLLIVFFEFKKTEDSSTSVVMNHYKIEENKVLDSVIGEYTKPLSLTSVTDKQWGIVPKKVKKVKKEENLTKEVPEVLVTLTKKTLCIEKECFKLLGIFARGKQHYASFYNKNSKKTVQEFLVGETIHSSIKIKTIMKKSIVFSDINSTREWKINLFDVNSSKYKPKEFKE